MDRVSRWGWGGISSSVVVPVRETSPRISTPFAKVRHGSSPPAVVPLQVKLKLYRREVERRTTEKHVGIAYSEDPVLPPPPPGSALPTPPAVLNRLRRNVQQQWSTKQLDGRDRPMSGSKPRSRPATASTICLSRHASRAKLAEHVQGDASPERPSTGVAQGAADLRRWQRRRPEGHGLQPSETDLALRVWTEAARARFGQGSMDSIVAMRGCTKWLATSCNVQSGAFRELADLEAACLDLGIAKEQAMDVAARMWAGLASDGRIPVKTLVRDLELPPQQTGFVVQKGTTVVSSTQLPDGTAAPVASGNLVDGSASTSAAIFGRSPVKPRLAKLNVCPEPETKKVQSKSNNLGAKRSKSPVRSGSKSPRKTRSIDAADKMSPKGAASACVNTPDCLIECVDSQSEEPFFDETMNSEDEAIEHEEVASALAGGVAATVCAGSRAIAGVLAASAVVRSEVHDSPAPLLEELPASVSPVCESPASVLETAGSASIIVDLCAETRQLVTALCARVVVTLEERDSAYCLVQSAVIRALERALAKQVQAAEVLAKQVLAAEAAPFMLTSFSSPIHMHATTCSSGGGCSPEPVVPASKDAGDAEAHSHIRDEPFLPEVDANPADKNCDEQHYRESRSYTHSVLLRVARRKLDTRIDVRENVVDIVEEDSGGASKASNASILESPDPGAIYTCPDGHTLIAEATPEENYNCDACKSLFPAATILWGCRSCNYDTCQDCLDSPERSALKAEENARQQQPLPELQAPPAAPPAAGKLGSIFKVTRRVSAMFTGRRKSAKVSALQPVGEDGAGTA